MNLPYLFIKLLRRITTITPNKFPNKSENILKISKKDAFKQYLAYHEGWGNYKNYKKNKKVIGLAKKVERQSNKYKNQLLKCKSKLNRKKYIIF